MVPDHTRSDVPPPALTGLSSRAKLESHPGWEHLRGQGYHPDPAAVATIRGHATDLQVMVFVGTWCPDSKRHVPRLLKLLDLAGVTETQLIIYGLDHAGMESDERARTWQVRYVPTFVFLRKGRELGRVVESPTGTLEGDVAAIVAGQGSASA
jgi:thiol-disulfide isomerase/thioredoxin